MSEESERGARLREALSQCDVFRDEGDAPAKGAPGGVERRRDKREGGGGSDDKRGAIRSALDKLFEDAGNPVAATPKPAAPLPTEAPREEGASRENAPASAPALTVDAVLARAAAALAAAVHFDPVGDQYAVSARGAAARVSLGNVRTDDLVQRLCAGRDPSGVIRAETHDLLMGSVQRRARVDVLPAPRGARYVVTGLSEPPNGSLEELGLDPEAAEDLRTELGRERGGLFLLGVAPRHGAGATLRGLGAEFASKGRLVVSLVPQRGSRPVPNLVEIDGSGSPEERLAEALRHDPDAVVVGRLVGREDTRRALDAAASGLRVFCAVNATRAMEAFAALRAFGAEDAAIAQTRPVFTSQRLLAELCLLCRESDADGGAALAALGVPEREARVATVYRAVGCDRCLGGYRGRFAVVESLSEPRPGSGAPERASRLSLRDAAFRAVSRGRTTVEELRRSMEGLGGPPAAPPR